tara:strand:+ start:378 stop:728 length:351 start_codon:yes stop_codon:yes gene_type:complete
MTRSSHKPTKKRLQSNDEEKRLLILEYLYGNQNGGSANFLRTANKKLRSQDLTQFQILLHTMVDREWIDKQDIDLGNRQQTTYVISENGKKVLETIKNLKDDNNPLAQLGIFNNLD